MRPGAGTAIGRREERSAGPLGRWPGPATAPCPGYCGQLMAAKDPGRHPGQPARLGGLEAMVIDDRSPASSTGENRRGLPDAPNERCGIRSTAIAAGLRAGDGAGWSATMPWAAAFPDRPVRNLRRTGPSGQSMRKPNPPLAERDVSERKRGPSAA